MTANAAAGSFLQIGAPATLTGNGSSGGNALIRQNGVVDGHLVLHGTLSTLGPFTITGTLTQNGNPVIPRLATKSFSVGSGSQTIASNTTLTPGNRGDVTVAGGRTVTFNAGTYNFASLTFDPDANLVANGNVIINVRNNFQLGDRADVINGSGLSLYAGGTLVRLGTDGTFNGVLSAPFANLTVSSRTHVVGCVGGENVTFDTDTTLTRGGRTLPLAP